MLHPMYDERPTPARTFPCPACGEFVAAGATACRHCSAPIDEQAAAFAAADFQRVHDAVTRANSLKLTSMVAAGFMVADPIFVLSGDGLNRAVKALQFVPGAALLAVGRWLIKYGRLETRDRDYPEAVRSMKRTLLFWLAALAVQVAVLAVYFQRS